jgi:hypothetical protein
MAEFVLNPKTNRMIAKNGVLHRKLLREGIFNKVERVQSKILADIPQGATTAHIEEIKKMLNKDLPKHSHAVIGRGQYKNKLVLRHRQLPGEYFTDLINNALDKDETDVFIDKVKSMPDKHQPPKLVRRQGYRVQKKVVVESSSDEESDEEEEEESDFDWASAFD